MILEGKIFFNKFVPRAGVLDIIGVEEPFSEAAVGINPFLGNIEMKK
jgi:hypothetical protein